MLEVREEDELELVPIPLKNVTPTIPKKESEMKELVEDLTRMGCEGLLAKPWNLRNEAVLKEFLFKERESMGEDDVARSGAADGRNMGGCVWVRSKKGRGVGQPEGHLLRRTIQGKTRSERRVQSGRLKKP
jgi:hypothetical protein